MKFEDDYKVLLSVDSKGNGQVTVIFLICVERPRRASRKLKSRRPVYPTQTRTEFLQNTSLRYYRHTNLFSKSIYSKVDSTTLVTESLKLAQIRIKIAIGLSG